MTNAQQSRTWKTSTADRAIDNRLNTASVTGFDNTWWAAELTNIVEIVNILVYVSDISFAKGLYNDFKVKVYPAQSKFIYLFSRTKH